MHDGARSRRLEVQIVEQIATIRALDLALQQIAQIELVTTRRNIEVGNVIHCRRTAGTAVGQGPLEHIGAQAAGKLILTRATTENVVAIPAVEQV